MDTADTVDAADTIDVVDERGSILPLTSLILALAVAASLVVVTVAGRAIDRAEAQSAADAAALAGVVEGEAGAVELARLNGAELVRFEETLTGVYVVVAVGSVRADAFAEPGWAIMRG